MFQNKVLIKTFGHKRKEIVERWRKLHNGELHDLNSSPTFIGVTISGRIKWVGYMAYSTCECINEPLGSIKCGEFLD
jgi:hypothetical protein